MSICINPNCLNPENKDTALFCQSCGSELLLDGRYRVTQELGGGGFGKTYEVIDCAVPTISAPINALKVLKVLSHNHPKYVELFQREAHFLARLNHPGIPRVDNDAYFTFQPHNSPEPVHCLVMEKIEGLDLKEYMSRRGSCIKQKQALQWLIQIAAILREIHSQHFFHRDIKPSNIMLRANGQLVLIDFGTAREVTETYMSKQSAGQVTGLFSAGYSPPEQLNGQAVPQSDFFALGRTFVYLLTGKHPNEFYDSYTDRLNWRESVPGISPLLADCIDHLMARLPSQRPQSTEVLLKELEDIYKILYGTDSISQTRGVTPPTTSPPPAVEPAHSKPTELGTSPPSPLPPIPPLDDLERISFEREQTLSPLFIDRCQHELANTIGPMAAIICQRLLKKQSQLSAAEFVQALAAKIPDPKQAEEFQKRLLS
jgi:serine/threonine protein kinase